MLCNFNKNHYLPYQMFIFVLTGIFLFACVDDNSNNSGTQENPDIGTFTFTLSWPEDTPQEDDTSFMARVDCYATGIATIVPTFYDSSGEILSSSPAEFNCEAHRGRVTGLLPGTGYRLQIDCKNTSGDVIFTGEITGVQIIAGQTTQGGEIEMIHVTGAFPTANIHNPEDNSVFNTGDSINFRGWGYDAEDGALTSESEIVWSSDIDGQIGIGEMFATANMSAGTHTITITVTDSDGNNGNASVNITVNQPGNTLPTATINSPADNSSYIQGNTITFSGNGIDNEDGTLTGNSLVWISSIDGQIGTNTSFTSSGLSIGTHTITLMVTDSNGATSTDTVFIVVSQDCTDSDNDGYYAQNGCGTPVDCDDNDDGIHPQTYDASGTWLASSSNEWANGCEPGPPETDTIIITQTCNNFQVMDSAGYYYSGMVSGATYSASGSIPDNSGTRTTNVLITLSSSTSGSGTVNYSWSDGTDSCNGGNDVSISKVSN